ncbi:MAG: Ig-like domain-containing protein [Candidatus Nanopelagicales bacterium]
MRAGHGPGGRGGTVDCSVGPGDLAGRVGAGVGDAASLVLAADTASVIRGSVVEVDVLANDFGPGGSTLVDPVLEISRVPMHGRAEVLDADGPGARLPLLSYRPAIDAPASDVFEYRVVEGGVAGTARVSFTVGNAPPSAAEDEAEVRSAAGSSVLIPVLANDSDPDGGSLVITGVSRPAHGTATARADGVLYDPTDDYVGADAFTYTLGDGQGGSASGAVAITVLDATTEMTLRPDTVTATAGVPVVVPVLANDSSGGRDPLTLVGVSKSRSGGSAVLTADGRGVAYTAPTSLRGSDGFSYSVRDRRGNVATGQVSVTVTAAPVAVSASAAIPTNLVVGRTTRIPVSVAGLDATGLAAVLQRKGTRGWAEVARTELGRSRGEIVLKASTGMAGLGPTRTTASIKLRVLLLRPGKPSVSSGSVSSVVRAVVGISVSGALKRSDVRYSYRPGCPVEPSSLRAMSINYWDYAAKLRRGTLVVRSDSVRDLQRVFTRAFDKGFQIKKMRPTDLYYDKGRRSPTASDRAAMRAGNTSAFNCRPVVGNPTKRSAHSYGVAIDINTFQNPYVVRGGLYPTGAGKYLRRSPCRTGMICRGGAVATAMAQRGWLWGARWSYPDYQHFSSNGG